MEFASWQSYRSFAQEVQRGRRYVWSKDVRSFLECVRLTAKKREFRIQSDQPLFRARVGWQSDVREQDDGTLDGPLALPAACMKPVPDRARAGRANAAGIPVLYLGVDAETAVAEVRPWIGSQVSVSLFRTTRELRALDLTQRFGKHWMPPFSVQNARFLPVDAQGKEKSVWTEIDNAFSRPVSRSDESVDYVPTQILAELFRDEGYEAICYRSRFGERGCNVAIFDLAAADPIDGRPYEVMKIEVSAEQVGNAWLRTPASSPNVDRS